MSLSSTYTLLLCDIPLSSFIVSIGSVYITPYDVNGAFNDNPNIS